MDEGIVPIISPRKFNVHGACPSSGRLDKSRIPIAMMNAFDSAKYGPLFASLLTPRLMPLGPGAPNSQVQTQLKGLEIGKAFAGKTIIDPDMAQCCLAGLWLYQDYLDESHTISQGIETPTGSYWHGFMHRRELDYGNAKYWFRRVGDHPVYANLAMGAKQLAANDSKAEKIVLAHQTTWDPFAFIDLCEKSVGGELEMLCRQIQQKEWEMLFDFCYCKATGRD
jgi:hypothetical protein